MTASVPSGSVGSLHPLAFATQSALGTPETSPAFSVNWTENTVRYNTSAHMIDTAVGSRASEGEGAQGRTMTQGDFAATLRTATMGPLIAAFFGSSTGGVASVTTPTLLTIFDDISGEINIYQDAMLSELVLSSQRQVEWTGKISVLGGLRTVGANTVTIPAVDMSGGTLSWSNTDITGLGSTVPCQISEATITLNNGVVQDFGAGNHAACAVVGGKFSIRFAFQLRYDDANAAAIEQDYVDGTHLGDVTVAITDGTSSHTLFLPALYVLDSEPLKPLGDFQRLRITAGSLDAANCTWAYS